MSAGKKYLRCACPACGHVITYPDYSAGGTSVCAKCSKPVKLPPAPATPAPAQSAAKPQQPIRTKEAIAAEPKPRPRAPQYIPAPKRRGPMRFVLWTLNLGVLVAVAIVLLNRQGDEQPSASNEPTYPVDPTAIIPPPMPPENAASIPPPPVMTPPPEPVAPPTPKTEPAVAPVSPPQPGMTNSTVTNASPPAMTTRATNSPPVIATNTQPAAPVPVPTPPPTLTTNSLVVTGLAIERPRGAKGSKLTYVTGLMQNEATAKRFGVRVDLHLLDQAGRPIAIATDYTPVIEPNGSWRFRALVLDQRAVSARVKEIKENQ